jgi:hypothetical protein
MTSPANSANGCASLLDTILGWLRAGYPQGVPNEVYIAIFAVLHRRLTEFEVRKIAAELAANDSPVRQITRDQIETAIAALALERPGNDDVARVIACLAEGGWNVTDPR